MTKRKLLSSPESDKRNAKAKRYDCKFQIEWTSEFGCITRDKKVENAFCKVCNSSFSISHGGRNDVKRHLNGKQHVTKAKDTLSTPTLKSMFQEKSPLEEKVTRAEVLFTKFVAEHNLAFTVADHFTTLCKEMFPDSTIAQKFSCRRTKTTHILNEAMGPEQQSRVADLCRVNKFSVMMDESNDQGDDKCVAILVRVLDRSVRKISTRFLAMPICNIGTGANLFSCLEQVFLDQGIPWGNCVGYGSDNASVMVGRHNSVLSRIKEKQPQVYDMGCVCHIANTCVQYGLKKLAVPAEELLIDVFFHFQHSSKRKEEYKDFLTFTDTEPAKIIKHAATRWLSLHKCVNRFLQQWPALKSYFSSHDDCEKCSSRVNRCYSSLTNPMFELTYHFLNFIMEPMNEFNTSFQANESKIGFLHTELVRLLRKFMGKFVKTRVITTTCQSKSITEVNFKSRENQHDDDMLAVGMSTRTYLLDNPDIPTDTVKRFFCSE